MDFDIFYIGYVDKKPDWNVNSVNPLYLLINKIDGYFEKINGVKYLNIVDTVKNNDIFKKYDQIFAGIKHHINKIDGSEIVYEKGYMNIKFLSDYDIPLNKMIYFPTVTVIIRCVFKQNVLPTSFFR